LIAVSIEVSSLNPNPLADLAIFISSEAVAVGIAASSSVLRVAIEVFKRLSVIPMILFLYYLS